MLAILLHQHLKDMNENVLEETSMAELLMTIENVHGHSPWLTRRNINLNIHGRKQSFTCSGSISETPWNRIPEIQLTSESDPNLDQDQFQTSN